MAKPAQDAKWATSGSALIADPGVGKRDTGWVVEIPPVEFMNWWMNNVGNWIEYLDQQVDAVAALQGVFDAIVGAGGTHADINALMADADIANIKNVFVSTTLSVDDTQVIDQDGMNFTFKAGAGITKNGPTGADTGLQVDGNRVRIINARFLSFNDVGDKAVLLNGNNSLIQGCMFNDNDTEIDDQGNNNVLSANIVEV